MSPKPIIGIPADRRLIDPHHFHAVGEKYIRAIVIAGGFPVLVPVLPDEILVPDILSRIDGLFLTGSPSNIEPHRYQGSESRSGTWHDPERDAITLPLIPAAIEESLPLFAVCRGFQELNVALGGTLHQHVHEVSSFDDHREPKDETLEVQYGASHQVKLSEGGLLNKVTGRETLIVNSLHSQGIDRLADGLDVEARATDGLVEAFRMPSATGFVLGVQWHPEWKVSENKESLAIFSDFVHSAREYSEKR